MKHLLIFALGIFIALSLIGAAPAHAVDKADFAGGDASSLTGQSTDNTTKTGTPSSQPATNPSAAPGVTPPPAGYVSLSNIPGLTDAATANQPNLASFFNALYKFCIGAAVILATIQLIRGGIMYMGGDSITNKEKGKEVIRMAVLGLLLVLSPAIVFGIINKDITSLKFSVDTLTVSPPATGFPSNSPANVGNDVQGFITSLGQTCQNGGGTQSVQGQGVTGWTYNCSGMSSLNDTAAQFAQQACQYAHGTFSKTQSGTTWTVSCKGPPGS